MVLNRARVFKIVSRPRHVTFMAREVYVGGVIALMRLNYERLAARQSLSARAEQ
jgi:hypothetical protein